MSIRCQNRFGIENPHLTNPQLRWGYQTDRHTNKWEGVDLTLRIGHVGSKQQFRYRERKSEVGTPIPTDIAVALNQSIKSFFPNMLIAEMIPKVKTSLEQ